MNTVRQILQPRGAVIACVALGSLVVAGQVEMTQGEEGTRLGAMQSGTSDYEVKSRIEKRLRLEDDVQWNDLSIQVHDGRAVIQGIVSTVEGKALATKLASTVPGVTQLENRIIVDPRLLRPDPEGITHSHIETTSRDRVLEAAEPLKDQQIMP